MLRLNKDTKTPKLEFDWKEVYMPQPGMLGTESVGSDSYSVVCVSVDSPKRVTVIRLWGLDENVIEDNPDIDIDDEGVRWMDKKNWKKYSPSKEEKWSLRKNGRWYQMNSSHSSNIHWGIANPYRDPSF